MYICFNGEFLPASQPIITAQNRSFKWGDGVFETMKIFNGKILLQEYHFDRLFLSLKMLQIQTEACFNQENLSAAILDLCEKNNCSALARVRLAVYRTEESQAAYLIESIPLCADVNEWNEDGVVIDLYPLARKQQDAFANLKSANYLVYVLAALYAKEKNLGEALVLNSSNFICDASKANIFLICQQQILTPALHQGCINGVMRRHIITGLKELGWTIKQEELTEADVHNAGEVFLTNAIHGLRPVKSFRDKSYTSHESKSIFNSLIAPLYNSAPRNEPH
jgi:branched-chain amino acid aminotransferase